MNQPGSGIPASAVKQPLLLRRYIVELHRLRAANAQLVQANEKLRSEMKSLAYLASHDPLTGLPNRTLLYDRIKQAIAAALRNNRQVIVLLFDLDGFKQINDTYGHEIGDKVLKSWANTVISGMRVSDTLARLSGDEFVAVLTEQEHSRGSSEFISRIADLSTQTVHIGNYELAVSASTGVYIVPHGTEATVQAVEAAIHCADQAMYQAKTDKSNKYHVYRDKSAVRKLQRV